MIARSEVHQGVAHLEEDVNVLPRLRVERILAGGLVGAELTFREQLKSSAAEYDDATEHDG